MTMKASKVSSFFQKYTMVLALVLVTAFFAWRTGGKTLLPANLNNLIAQNGYVFVLASGMLLCILTGGNIDLSVGSVVCFTAAIGCKLMKFGWNMWATVLVMLAIGLVVDDAIVMVENISFHISRGMGILAASWKGAQEVGFAIIATTLVLIMIFLPLMFMQGITGAMFIEFAAMMSLAVLFSGFIALTLSPALASVFLKPGKTGSKNYPVRFFNFIMKWLHFFYEKGCIIYYFIF